MEIECCALTDVGCVRTNNEDALGVDETCRLVVLADGMGGYNAGEVASAMAIEHTMANLNSWLQAREDKAEPVKLECMLQNSVDQTNRAIFEMANTRPECAGMGTTIVLALLHENRAFIGHVGDSRAYLWRDNTLKRLTRDHSLVQEYIDNGLLTEADAALSGYRSLLTRALGVEDTVLLEVDDIRLQVGDLLMLCSDGLTDMLDDTDIAVLLRRSGKLEQKAQSLIDEAKVNGGRDNVSVALVKVIKLGRKHENSFFNPLG